jgi:SAM-dependent methyltransferase
MSRDTRTYRRILLDEWLLSQNHLLAGCVVDIGGKRAQKRGNYRPPEAQAGAWIYVNIDPATNPDVLADAAVVPLPDETVDVIICTETLEHVANPQAVMNEIHRLLRPGGVLIGSIPFLYPVHADPHDFQRFTPEGLRTLAAKFNSIELTAMGGSWGTLALLLELVAQQSNGENRYWRAVRWRIARLVAQLGYWLDGRSRFTIAKPWPAFTTGYGFVAHK